MSTTVETGRKLFCVLREIIADINSLHPILCPDRCIRQLGDAFCSVPSKILPPLTPQTPARSFIVQNVTTRAASRTVSKDVFKALTTKSSASRKILRSFVGCSGDGSEPFQ